ncbi:MAG TPA: biopolymer transporter ExbD [Kofleriaceae bacterium]|jgi:biopolymer transport protein ExbD|nr:biopolymer transporter ExbD [Kofleriaceae bacterium]
MGMDLDTGGPKKSVRPVMNVAPLVDVVLVLLIIFMVITPLLGKQMTVNVPVKPEDKPEPAPRDDDAEPQIVMWIDQDGRIHVNGETVEPSQLGAHLQAVFAPRRDRTLFLDSHDEVPFERAVVALDLARGAGLTQIAVLTEPIAELKATPSRATP